MYLSPNTKQSPDFFKDRTVLLSYLDIMSSHPLVIHCRIPLRESLLLQFPLQVLSTLVFWSQKCYYQNVVFQVASKIPELPILRFITSLRRHETWSLTELFSQIQNTLWCLEPHIIKYLKFLRCER